MRMKHLAFSLVAMILAACAAIDTHSWGEWVSPDIAGTKTEDLSIFDWSKHPGTIISIDGVTDVRTGFKSARLRPGKHIISYADHPDEFGIHPKGSFDMEMKSGHQYRFGIRYCFTCTPRKYAVWIDDTTTGEIAWGSRPDWRWRW
jgi:hypothetical protein